MSKIILTGVTIEKLKNIVNEAVTQVVTGFTTDQTSKIVISHEPEKKYIYSIRGLAKFMNCSPTTVLSYKSKGIIPFRQSPHAKRFIFVESEILEAMARNGIKGLSETSKSEKK